MELRSVGHENASNVIATLTETHTRGRYRIVGGQTFPVNPNQSERDIDLYFTDGDTVLDGAYGSGSGTAASIVSSIRKPSRFLVSVISARASFLRTNASAAAAAVAPRR